MRLKFIFLLLILPIFCQAQNEYIMEGKIIDMLLNTPLPKAKVEVFSLPDSVLLDTAIADHYLLDHYTPGSGEVEESQKSYTGGFRVGVQTPGSYLLKISDHGFITLDKEINIKKRDYYTDLGNLYLEAEATDLGEVVVRTSKVKFYHKGDTLVYNADAFRLAEGSMLDALIKQLPGVELNDEGQIMVNGKFVESLLLNGRDFFGDNRKLMLDNLGAYTVKNIEVYDKASRLSELAGTNLGDESYVMDVKLKKEYMVGSTLNVEGGYGSSDRYLGRIFAMAFTSRNRYAAYFNVNNLNDSRKPGENSSWTPEAMPTGVRRTISGGFDYSLRPKNDKWELDGHANASGVNEHDGTDIVRTNFLPGTNTYDYAFNRMSNHTLQLSTNHKVYFKGVQGYGVAMEPFFRYQRWNNLHTDISATFDEAYNDVTTSFIEEIYSGDTPAVLGHILNRNIERNRLKGHSLSTGTNLWQGIKMPWGSNLLIINLIGEYNRRHENRLNDYVINFGSDPNPSTQADRIFNNYPDFDYTAGVTVGYNYIIKLGMSLGLEYGFTHHYNRETSNLYVLENSDARNEYVSGLLPSLLSQSPILDPLNSYLSKERNIDNRLKLLYIFSPSINDNHFRLVLEYPLIFANRTINYRRGGMTDIFRRHYILFDNSRLYMIFESANGKHEVNVAGELNSKTPDMKWMVDICDTTDPMNIIIGNPGLRQALNQQYVLSYQFRPSSNKIFTMLRLEANIWHNSFGQSVKYDSKTGVREMSYANVNGNSNYNARVTYRQYIGRIQIGNTLKAAHQKSVDLTGYTGEEVTESRVNDLNFSDNLSLTYSFGKGKVSLNFDGRFNRYTGESEFFMPQNTWTLKTGLNALFSLPYNFELSTDFSIFNRRGYVDNNLNTDNYVWNARLSYKALKGSLLFMLDGYDILHDLKNVSYTMNAQARTEVYRTVLPRYVMFHIQWFFNHTPMKKK